MPALTCGKDLLKAIPCLNCQSEKDLLAMQAYAWINSVGKDVELAPADLIAVQKNWACFECMTDTQLLAATVAVEINKFDPGESFSTRIQEANLLLKLPKHRLLALIAYLKCQYWATH
jgi:hypothetical protein